MEYKTQVRAQIQSIILFTLESFTMLWLRNLYAFLASAAWTHPHSVLMQLAL